MKPDLEVVQIGRAESFKAWEHGYPFHTVRWHFHPEYELHQVVATSEIVDRLRHIGDERDGLARDPSAQLQHVLDILRPQISFGEPLVGLLQVFREARRPVAMHRDVHTLDLVERGANLLARHLGVAEEINEFLDRPLEVDVVLPERVVAVDQEKLASGRACHPPKATLAGTGRGAGWYEGIGIDPWRAGHWTT